MMEADSDLRFSDEYRLLETYCQKKKKPTLKARACMFSQAPLTDEKFDNVAEKLTKIVEPLDSVIQMTQVESEEGLECDGPEDPEDHIAQLVELLKKSGDDINEKILKNHKLQGYLQHTFDYNSFKNLTNAFVSSVLPVFSQRSECEKIALTFEVTSRLKALDLLPVNRVMGYGTEYLQKYFTSWVKQQGGWEKVFDGSDEEEVH